MFIIVIYLSCSFICFSSLVTDYFHIATADALPQPSQNTIDQWSTAQTPSGAGETVQLPPDLCGWTDPVFVRHAHIELVRVILALQNHPDSKVKNTSVYGTPGVGKSVFASLLVFYLAEQSPGSVVFYTAINSDSQGKFLVFRPGGSVRYMSAPEGTALISQLGDSSDTALVWVIVDGYKPPPGTLKVTKNRCLRTVMVSSSNLEKKGWLHEWDKHVHFRLLMPPFSWEEMEYALTIRTPPEQLQALLAVIGDRFAVFGGIPRLVLSVSEEPPIDIWRDEMMPGASKDLLFRTLTDTAEGLQTASIDGKSRLIHLYPAAELPSGFIDTLLNYSYRVPQFASKEVSTELVHRLDQAGKERVAVKLQEACVHGNGAVIALLFEPSMHAQLQRGEKFKDSFGNERALFPAPTTSLMFESAMTVHDAPVGVYMQPKSKSFASIDAFIKVSDEAGNQRVMLFQMTGQKSHPINMPGLKRLFAVPANTPEAVAYQETRKRGGASVTYHVLVPAGTTLTFILTPNRLPEFALPQGFVGSKSSLQLQCSTGVDMRIKEQMLQCKVAPSAFCF